MATDLSIDPDLIKEALELSGERTKKAAVTKALQEFIARRTISDVSLTAPAFGSGSIRWAMTGRPMA